MYNKAIPLCLALVLWLGPAAAARAEFASSQYPYCQEVKVTTADTYNIELNSEVLNACKTDFGDIRLTDRQGQELPYYLETYLGPGDVLKDASLIDDYSPDADHHQIEIDSQDDHFSHNSLLVTVAAGRNMYGDVLIEGSYDKSDYEALSMSRIYVREDCEYTNELLYPIKKYRYLRLNINSEDAAEIHVRKIQYVYRQPHEPSLILRSTMLVNSNTQAGEGASSHIVDLGVKNLTVHNILISSPALGFTRLVNVYDSNDGDSWRLLRQEARIFDQRWDNYSGRNDSVEINANVSRFLKVEILDEGEPALDVSGVDVLGMVPRLAASLPAGTYRLYYGNPEASAPQYQQQPLPVEVQNQVHPVLESGRQMDNPEYKAPSGYVPLVGNNQLVNIVLLACFLSVAGILARNIVRSLRRRSP